MLLTHVALLSLYNRIQGNFVVTVLDKNTDWCKIQIDVLVWACTILNPKRVLDGWSQWGCIWFVFSVPNWSANSPEVNVLWKDQSNLGCYITWAEPQTDWLDFQMTQAQGYHGPQRASGTTTLRPTHDISFSCGIPCVKLLWDNR